MSKKNKNKNKNEGPALERFRASREPLRQLIHALVEDLLDRPLVEFLDRGALPAEITQVFRDVVREPANIAWFSEQLATGLQRSKQWRSDEIPADRLPSEAVEPLRKLATQPLSLNREFARAILDHPAFHGLVRVLLTKSLLGYSKQVAELFPGGKLFTGLVGRGSRLVASGLGNSTASLEHRAAQFVEEALAPSISRAAAYLAEEKSSESLSDWRGHILETLLTRPEAELVALVGRVEPEALAVEIAGLMEAFAQWSELEGMVEMVLNVAIDAAGQQSLRQLIAGHDLERQLRPLLEESVLEAVWPFCQGEAFSQWLESIQ